MATLEKLTNQEMSSVKGGEWVFNPETGEWEWVG